MTACCKGCICNKSKLFALFLPQCLVMTEFWLISAPGEKTCQQTWDKLMVATTRTNNLSTNNKFNIPDLKVFCLLFLLLIVHTCTVSRLITCSCLCQMELMASFAYFPSEEIQDFSV